MARNSLLDPVVIAQLGNLHLRARRILDGLYSGHHANLNRGHSQDFSEHRPYNPGDDPKGLDWKIFGRTDKLVIKQYEEQTNIGAMVMIDDSQSMNFSWNGGITKMEYAKSLAAAMGYLVISQNDAIGLVSSGTRLGLGTHRGHLDRYFQMLEQLQPKGVWNLSSVMQMMGSLLKKRGFVIVFSDLMGDADQLISSLRTIHARKHDVIVFQLLDPAEKTLPYTGSVLFEDMETGEKIKTEPETIRKAYQEWVDSRLAMFSQVFRSSGIDYISITTDAPFDKGMGAYLSWRGQQL